MFSYRPFEDFRKSCELSLKIALESLYALLPIQDITLQIPPNSEFGELASSLCFELSRQLKMNPRVLAEKIVKEIDGRTLIKNVEVAGAGYINFRADFSTFTPLVLDSVCFLNKEYGCVKHNDPKKIIVEHTSVNPIHPIHIGQARNSILGDAISRILKLRGHRIFRHYYIDDVGRQTAVIAYGYEKLKKPKPQGKPDHFIGSIYTVTSCLTEIHRLKSELNISKSIEESSKIKASLEDWLSIAEDLKREFPDLYLPLAVEISKDADPESCIRRLIQDYESGEKTTKNLLRKVCKICIEGFKDTLSKVGISFDSWDWESDLIWQGDVGKMLERLQRTPYVFQDNVLEFDAEKIAMDLSLKEKLGLKNNYDLPSLTLVRANGTSLYTTRDISYSLRKFQTADQVINVVGAEQILPQIQLKLALYALGHNEYAESLIHFPYSLVRFPNYRMSSRRGRYIALDEVIDEAVEKAYEAVSERSPRLSKREKTNISNTVGIGAIKYALVEVDPLKPVIFTWDRVIDFEKNSAPYLQYSYARARSILEKSPRDSLIPDYSLLSASLEHQLILLIARFPDVFINAAETLKPHLIADFVNTLADKFNSFYASLPVLKAKPLELSDARLVLVEAVKIVLKTSLNILGIETLKRM